MTENQREPSSAFAVYTNASQAHIEVNDAMSFLRSLPDASVDAVVTDPPFGLGKQYAEGREVANTPDAYWLWLQPIIAECNRVLKPGGLLCVWQAGPNLKHVWRWFGDDVRVYVGAKNFVQLRPTPINHAWDPIVMYYKPGEKALRPEKPQRNVDFFVANTASVVSDPTRIERAHPFPRPLDQVVEIVRNFVVPGGIIVDPFVGSGTTAVAALATGRRFIGCDISPQYVNDIAWPRLAKSLEVVA